MKIICEIVVLPIALLKQFDIIATHSTNGEKKMNRMAELHIQYLNDLIEEGGKFAAVAKEELDQIKAELAKNGIFIA